MTLTNLTNLGEASSSSVENVHFLVMMYLCGEAQSALNVSVSSLAHLSSLSSSSQTDKSRALPDCKRQRWQSFKWISFSKIYYDIIMFSSVDPGVGRPSELGPLVHSPSLDDKEERKRWGKRKGKLWLCANRTQRHCETQAALFFHLESGD